MNTKITPPPDPDTQHLAVAKTLERKRRLGQYAVLWSGGAPIAVGEYAPVQLKSEQAPRLIIHCPFSQIAA